MKVPCRIRAFYPSVAKRRHARRVRRAHLRNRVIVGARSAPYAHCFPERKEETPER